MATTSGTLGGYIYSSQNQPSLAIYEWDVTEAASPVGYRSVVSGVASFVKQLGPSSAASMQFEDTVLDFSSDLDETYAARVQCFTFINTTGTFRLSNMKVWMPSGTALDTGAHLEIVASGTWHHNAVLPSGAGFAMPTSLPATQNVFRQDNDREMWLTADTHSSEFVYMGLHVPSGLTFGRYGIDGTGDLVFRITYDWFDTLVPTYQTPEGYPNYPRNWAYPFETPAGATSGFHYYEDEVWMQAPYARDDELLIALFTVGNYNMGNVTAPPEWTQIYQGGSVPDMHAYYKTYDEADASGMSYQWLIPFSNGNDAVGHVIRIMNGGTPIASGWQKSSNTSQATLTDLTITEKAVVLYYFTSRADVWEITELPSDIIIWASGAGQAGDYNVPNWAIGYKNYPQAGVDGGGTFAGQDDIGCLRIVIPYEAQHFLPAQSANNPLIS